jgi:hypothetical protein
MKSPIFLMRFFDTDEHRNDFFRGGFYMRNLTSYKTEDTTGNGINDYGEGTVNSERINNMRIILNFDDGNGDIYKTEVDENVTALKMPSSLTGDAYISSWTLIPNKHLIFNYEVGKYELDTKFVQQVYQTYNEKRFGVIVVLQDLIDAFEIAAKKQQLDSSYSPIHYGNILEIYKENTELVTAYGELFVKSKKFKEQYEFRFITFIKEPIEGHLLQMETKMMRFTKFDEPFSKKVSVNLFDILDNSTIE